MKISKSILTKSLVLTIVLVLLFAACGTGGAGGAADGDAADGGAVGGGAAAEAEETVDVATPEGMEHVTVHMFGFGLDAVRSSLDDSLGRRIFDEIGVEIQFIPVTGGAYEVAMMMLAAQDWGTLDFAPLWGAVWEHIHAGALVNLDEHRDRLPNFFAYHADTIPYKRIFDRENHGLYFWSAGPDHLQMTLPPLDMVVRTDALEALGWPDLDTTDDYVNFLRDALEAIPESSGMRSIGMVSFWGEGGGLGPLLASYLPRHSGLSHPYNVTLLVDPSTQSFIPQISHPYSRATWEFWNTLWREGIMDREIWTDTFADVQAKANSGVPISIHFKNWAVTQANQHAMDRGDYHMQYIVTPIRLSAATTNRRYEIINMARGDEFTGILRTSPHVDRIIELINLVSTEEFTMLQGFGIEGEDYTWEGNHIVMTPYFIQRATGDGAGDWLNERGFFGGYVRLPMRWAALLADGIHPARFDRLPSFRDYTATDRMLEAYRAMGWANSTYPWTNSPHFQFIPFDISVYQNALLFDPDSEEQITFQRIDDFIISQIPFLINAATVEEFEDLYRDVVDQAYAMGLDWITERANENLIVIQETIEALRGR